MQPLRGREYIEVICKYGLMSPAPESSTDEEMLLRDVVADFWKNNEPHTGMASHAEARLGFCNCASCAAVAGVPL